MTALLSLATSMPPPARRMRFSISLRSLTRPRFPGAAGVETISSAALDEARPRLLHVKVNRVPVVVELATRAAQLQRPGHGLTAVAELRKHLDALELLHVENALRGGWSWSRIAAALGVSKQAANGKHARRLRPKSSGDTQ